MVRAKNLGLLFQENMAQKHEFKEAIAALAALLPGKLKIESVELRLPGLNQ